MIKSKQVDKARELIGQKVDYTFNGMTVKVKVLDVKVHGPLLLYQISPVNGTGTKWVQKFTKTAN